MEDVKNVDYDVFLEFGSIPSYLEIDYSKLDDEVDENTLEYNYIFNTEIN